MKDTTQIDHYFRGDACGFTGRTRFIAGGLFYIYELLEGHRKGEEVFSQDPPRAAHVEVSQ